MAAFKAFIFFFLIALPVLPQAWQPSTVDWSEELPVKKKFYELSGSVAEVSFIILVNGYRLFVSEPDGENCPFDPSCSRFFIESLKQTNLFEAILLASDRLIRDTSFGNKHRHYHIDKFGKLIDPPSRYIELE